MGSWLLGVVREGIDLREIDFFGLGLVELEVFCYLSGDVRKIVGYLRS